MSGPGNVLPQSTIEELQYVLLGLGISGSLFTAFKIAGHSSMDAARKVNGLVPHLVVLGVFAIVNIYLFTQPMAHRA